MRPDLIAATSALHRLASVHGQLGMIKLPGRSWRIHVEDRLQRNPRRRTSLKWVSDTGFVRKGWARGKRKARPLAFYRYYGPWGGRHQTRSVYVVIFVGGGPALEVRLSQRGGSAKLIGIRHSLAFRGASYKDPAAMRQEARRLVARTDVPVRNDGAELGAYGIPSGSLRPGAKRLLLRAIACALVAHDIRVRARSRSQSRKRASRKPAKRKRAFKWQRGQVITMELDRKFESQALHERLIDDIRADLDAHGIESHRQHPYDLVVRKGRR